MSVQSIAEVPHKEGSRIFRSTNADRPSRRAATPQIGSAPSNFSRRRPAGACEILGQALTFEDSDRISPLNVRCSMATLPSPPDDLTPEQLFLGHQKLIEEVIAHTCRRSHFSPQDADDFEGLVWDKLIEDNYCKIREYRGRSSFKTYITVVIKRLLFDYRDHLWGKWRNSAEALRLGPVAMRLETLLVREGYTFAEACQILWTNDKVAMSDLELADLRGKLPPRIPRHFIGEELLQAEPSRDPGPDERVLDQEREGNCRRVLMGLRRALDTLPAEDKVLVQMRTEFSVANIARLRGMDQKRLYRRLDKIYDSLRKALERQGVRRQDVEEILETLEPEALDF
jgi:RNA polymerase sigma factor (sigma-70 family)